MAIRHQKKDTLHTMREYDDYSTWIEIELSAIEKNVELIRKKTGVRVMAVVKANAYGHGTVPVARASLQGGATWLGVARTEEALNLREAGLDCPILVLGYSPAGKVSEAIIHNVSLTLWSGEQLKHMSSSAVKVGKQAKLHLKVDTGMSRLGVQPNETLAIAEEINKSPGVIFEGIFTHFARADEEDPSATENQGQKFRNVLKSLTTSGINPPLVHAANSAAALSQPSSYFNMVRPGIAIYGLEPSKKRRLPEEFQAALMWKSVLSQVKTLPPGRGISYGHEYVTRGIERLGTVPVGYADGFRRVRGNQVLIGGKHIPVVGRVCMDQISVQLDEVPSAQEGDEVVIIGPQGDVKITAEQVAELWGTINYEVVCGIGARVPRIYKYTR
jgi:alanine racemase